MGLLDDSKLDYTISQLDDATCMISEIKDSVGCISSSIDKNISLGWIKSVFLIFAIPLPLYALLLFLY